MMAVVFGVMVATSFVYALLCGSMQPLSEGVMTAAEDAVTLLIRLSGVLCMWSGFMEIARRSGLMQALSKALAPLLSRLFPRVDRHSDAFAYITMNVSANLLGLGNAATPLGLSAMRELRRMSDSDTATDEMVTFVIMNTASMQLLPTTVATLRHSYGSSSPFDIIVCVWISSAAALAVGLLSSRIIGRKGNGVHRSAAACGGMRLRAR